MSPDEAAAQEADKWASGLCSKHQRPDPTCHICNPKLVFGELVNAHRNAAWAHALTIILKELELSPTLWASGVKAFINHLPKEEPR